MQFEFATAGRLLFGRGTVKRLAELTAPLGKRPLVVTGRSPARAEPALSALAANSRSVPVFTVSKEPTVELIEEGVNLCRETQCDCVVGMGGGSALDAAKAVSALATNPGCALDYLEVLGRGKPLVEPPLPVIAVPTTAGTGSEVTRNAVLASPAHQVKVSLRSPLMLPRLALVDPELTVSMPPAVTAATGLDALTQLVEPYVSRKAHPLTDGLCREGLARVARSLERAVADGKDLAAREDMALASLLGGLALANAGLGAAHGFAGPLGGLLGAPHGVLCARLLPAVIEANLRVADRDDRVNLRARYTEVARVLTGEAAAEAEAAATWVRGLLETFDLPALAALGLTIEGLATAVEKAKSASSMKANPVTLTDAELRTILEQSL